MVELAAKVIPMVVGFLESLGAAIDRWVVPALEDLAPKLERLLNSRCPLLEKLEPLADLLGTAFGAALYNIVTQLGLIAEAVAVAVEAFTALSDAFDNAGAKAREFVDDVGDGLGRLREVVEPALEAAKAAVASWAVQMAANAVTAGTRFVGSIALWLATLPTRVKGFLDGVIAKLPPWAQDMARGAVEGAESFVSSLLGELASLPRKVYQSGVSIVSGLIGGIRSMADSAGRAMAGVVSSIAAYLPRSPAKKGALSGRGWSLYSGKAISRRWRGA